MSDPTATKQPHHHGHDHEHDPHAAHKSPAAPKHLDPHKPLNGNQTASTPKKSAAQPQRQQNPTYTDARLYAEQLFRRQGEMVGMMGNAARDGLTAFSLRSSAAYNDAGNIGLALFEVALAAFPAASSFAKALAEMKSARNSLALIGKLKSISERAEKIHHGLEEAEPVVKGIEATKGLAHSVGEVGEKREAQTETQEKAEFQIETLSSLRELTEDGAASRWAREDSISGLMQLVEYSDPSIDLGQVVREVLGPMPAPGDLAALKPVAVEFEMKLYERYYLDTGKVTKQTVHIELSEGPITWAGIPEAVVERFRETGKMDVLENHPKVKHIDELRTLRN